MKSMKRLLALLLCLVMVCSCMPLSAFAAGGATNVYMTVEKTEVNEGETFTVSLSCTGMTVKGFTAGIQYDKDLLTLESIVSDDPEAPEYFGLYSSEVKGGWVEATAVSDKDQAIANGQIGFGYAGTKDRTYDASVLFTAKFTAMAAGTATFVAYEQSNGTDDFRSDNAETKTVVIKGDESACDHVGKTYSYESNDNGTHKVKCECGAYVDEDETCTGGTATCTAKAKCSKCLADYGSLGAHDYGDLIPEQAAVHTQTDLKGAVAAHYECSVCHKLFTADKAETTEEALTGTAPTHTADESKNQDVAVTKEPTCTEEGTKTVATFCSCGIPLGTKEVSIPAVATNHSWNTPTYSWNYDYTACTATRVCTENAEHQETVEATVTPVVKTPATCTEKGWTTYTATFEGCTWEGIATQTKDVQDIPATDHDWEIVGYDNCGPTEHDVFYVCKNDSTHTKTEDVEHTYDANGLCVCGSDGCTNVKPHEIELPYSGTLEGDFDHYYRWTAPCNGTITVKVSGTSFTADVFINNGDDDLSAAETTKTFEVKKDDTFRINLYDVASDSEVTWSADFAYSHSPADDDGDCTTAIRCTVCNAVTTEAKTTHIDGDDLGHVCDNDGCTVDNVSPHTPANDDGDCTTAILCTECGAVTTAAETTHAFNNKASSEEASPADCQKNQFMKAQCDRCNAISDSVTVEVENTKLDHNYTGEIKNDGDTHSYKCVNGCNQYGGNADHTPADDDGDCTTAIECTACGAVTTEAEANHAWVICGYSNDGETHTVHYACEHSGCNETKDESGKDHTYVDGVCVCEKLQTYTVKLKDNKVGVKIDSVNGVAVAEDAAVTAEHGKKLVVVLKNTASNLRDDVYTSKVTCDGTEIDKANYTVSADGTTVTILGEYVKGEIEITAKALLKITVDMAGGKLIRTGTYDPDAAGTTAIRQDDNSRYGCQVTLSEYYFERDGYTLKRAIDSNGQSYGTTEFKCTSDMAFTLVWECTHEDATTSLDDKGDGTHDVICDRCEGVLKNEAHTYNEEDGTYACECGAVKAFTLAFVDDDGNALHSFQVPYGTKFYDYTYEDEDEEVAIRTYTQYWTDLLSQVTTEPTKEHMTFSGWNLEYLPNEMYADTVTVTPKWEFVMYTVTWDLDGGNYVGGEDMTTEAGYGWMIKVFGGGTFTKEGYELSHFEDQNGARYELQSQSDFKYVGYMPGYDIVLKAVWTPAVYKLDIDYVAPHEGGPYKRFDDLKVSYGDNLLDVLSWLKEEQELPLPAVGSKHRWKNDSYNGEVTVTANWEGYIESRNEWFTIDENSTMPAEDLDICQSYSYTGWVISGDDMYYKVEDVDLFGWNFVKEDYDGVDGGAWYYFDLDNFNCRVEGLSKVPYPADKINGVTYAADAETLEYCADKGIEFIDADTAWFLFDENGKFQSNVTGMGTYNDATRYMQNGILAWHPGMVEIDGSYYYFIGDEAEGGNIAATGDVYISRNTTDRNFVIGGVYTFDNFGNLCEYNGITNMSNGTKRYYKDAQLMLGKGLTEVDGKYIFVRSNGELVVDAEYWVDAEDFKGIYKFDEDGFMIIPEPDPVKDGVYYENDGWYYYENGVIGYNKGLMEVTEVWYSSEGPATMTAIIYVRSNGQLAVGSYYVTNVANYNGTTPIASGTKLIFGNTGTMVRHKNGIVAEKDSLYYYQNGVIAYNAGVIQLNGNYYYVRSNGEVVNDRSYWITNVGDSGVVAKQYHFDANGVMENPEFVQDQLNGIVDGYYYVDGKIAYAAGVVKLSDEKGEFYIYVRSNGQLAVGNYWPTNTNGYDLSGSQNFGTDGKLYI